MKRRELIKGILGLSAIAATGIKLKDERFQGKRRVVNGFSRATVATFTDWESQLGYQTESGEERMGTGFASADGVFGRSNT